MIFNPYALRLPVRVTTFARLRHLPVHDSRDNWMIFNPYVYRGRACGVTFVKVQFYFMSHKLWVNDCWAINYQNTYNQYSWAFSDLYDELKTGEIVSRSKSDWLKYDFHSSTKVWLFFQNSGFRQLSWSAESFSEIKHSAFVVARFHHSSHFVHGKTFLTSQFEYFHR